MSQVPPGWRSDPYGRFQQRYWDGERWTEHVATGGMQQVDPLGATTVIPIATPPTAFAAAAGGDPPGENAVTRLLDRVGADVGERPVPRLRSALAGLGGAIVAAGIVVVAAPDHDPRVALVVTSLIVLAAALGLRLAVPAPEVRAAATGMAAVAIPTFAIAATVSDGSSDFLTYGLLFALYGAAWALPGFRGRNLFLALAAVSLLAAFGSLTSDDHSRAERCNRYLDEGDWDRFDAECGDYYGDSGVLPSELTDNIGTQGAIYLVGGGTFLGAAWWLDRRHYRGAGTAMAAAGVVASLTGAVLLLDTLGETWGPLLLTAVGIVICLVGSHGSRRATTWWGAWFTTVGTVAFIATTAEPTTKGGAGGVLIGSGLLLVLLPLLAEPIRRAQQQSQPPPAPPAAPSAGAELPPPGFDPGI